MNLEDYLQSAKESLFRFEYLQEFDVPEERELFKIYETTGKVEICHIMQDWWNFLVAKHKESVTTQRVRLIRLPLSKYLEWELNIHKQTVEYGDDIRILSENKLKPEVEKLGDFWLIDNKIALKMNYDIHSKYLGFEKMEPHPYIKAKEYLLANSKYI